MVWIFSGRFFGGNSSACRCSVDILRFMRSSLLHICFFAAILISSSVPLSAQCAEEYQEVLRLAKESLSKREYRLAINRFLDARDICPDNRQEVTGFINETFRRITAERNTADSLLRVSLQQQEDIFFEKKRSDSLLKVSLRQQADILALNQGYQKLIELMKYGPQSARDSADLDELLNFFDKTQLGELAYLYDLAFNFILIDDYEEAYEVFRFLVQKYPSSEMYNDLAATKALIGFSKIPRSEVSFVYPISIGRTQGLIKGKGVSTNNSRESVIQNLEEAQFWLDSALIMNPSNTTALVNQGCIWTMLAEIGENKDQNLRRTVKIITRVIELARSNPALINDEINAYILKGIVYQLLGNYQMRDKVFQTAKEIVELNESNIIFRFNEEIHEEKFDVFTDELESIDGIAPFRLIRESSVSMDSKDIVFPNGSTIYFKSYPNSKLLVSFQSSSKYSAFLSTNGSYEGSSSRGIRIGDAIAEVKEAYGVPLYEINPSQAETILFYKKAQIIFRIDLNGKVKGWTIFHSRN